MNNNLDNQSNTLGNDNQVLGSQPNTLESPMELVQNQGINNQMNQPQNSFNNGIYMNQNYNPAMMNQNMNPAQNFFRNDFNDNNMNNQMNPNMMNNMGQMNPNMMNNMNQGFDPSMNNQMNSNMNQNIVKPKKDILSEQSQIKKKTSDDDFLIDYIGKNYDSIVRGSFNVPAFLFGPTYAFYRKSISSGLLYVAIVLVLEFVCILLFKSAAIVFEFIIAILGCIIYGMRFNNNYTNRARKKIAKIREQNPNADEFTISNICVKKGGTSILQIFLGSFLLSICMSALVFVFVLILGLSFFGSMFKGGSFNFGDFSGNFDIDESSYTTTTNSEYVGALIYDTSFNVETVNVKIPDGFTIDEDFSDTSTLRYRYYENNVEQCGIKIGAVSGYTDSKTLYDQMIKFYSNFVPKDSVKDVTINNKSWHYFKNEGSLIHNYYLTDHNGKVVLFEYDSNNLDVNCAKLENDIVNSIELK